MILVLDNHDSFTYNLVQAVGSLGVEVEVRTNDEVTVDEVEALDPDGIVISPGPGHPARDRDFGVCGPVLEQLSPSIPTLGVCLGLQGFVHRYGGTVEHAPGVVHGKSSPVHHDGSELFDGIPDPFEAGRYHSLVVADLGEEIEEIAWTDDDLIMGARHVDHPIWGVQFHPESVLTEDGPTLLANFARRCT